MARSELMSVVIVAIVLTVSFKQASALKCWECSWSGVELNTQFCKDPFERNETNNWAYRECLTKSGYNIYCRKTIDNINNNTVIISRGCYQRLANETKETCSDHTLSSIKTETCLLCTEDGCNSAVQYTSTIAFIVASMMLAQILSV